MTENGPRPVDKDFVPIEGEPTFEKHSLARQVGAMVVEMLQEGYESAATFLKQLREHKVHGRL